MKVVTIGRSSSNNVRIDDPYVGRYHCQIVQHDDGSFTIVDMNSTNGTFVNGKRIYGEVPLLPSDVLTIGHSNLNWMLYYSSKQKSKALPIVLGSVGGALLLVLVLLLMFKLGSDKAFAFKGEYPNAVPVDMIDDDGTPYIIEAIEGQVCVWFDEGVSFKTARKSIRLSGGKIVAQIPDKGYYLAKAPTDRVQLFLDKIEREPNVDWAYPNMLSYPCVVNNYILDNFYSNKKDVDTTPHGLVVQKALQEYGSNIPLKPYNIGNKNGRSMCTTKKLGDMCVNSEFFALDSISMLTNNGPIFINMSYGPSLPERKNPNGDSEYYRWNMATKEEKRAYQIGYQKTIKKTIQNLKPLEGKDYVVVVAAGNEGVKSFDEDIITYLRKSLTSEELEVMDKHFLLVTAAEKEKGNRYYSNEMEANHYDPWVTQVDISNFKYKGKKWNGTSFAAPRAAGILSSVANEKNLTGAEVLKYARETTLNSRDHHTLTYESLKETVIAHQQSVSNQSKAEQSQTSINSEKKESSSIGSKTDSSNKPTSAMGWYDYSATIPYSQDLFNKKAQGRINLPNGDIINYQYFYECDFLPEYYMKFTLCNGANITSKYRIALVETMKDEKGYVGTDEDGYIDMRISYFGFNPESKKQMIVLIRKK